MLNRIVLMGRLTRKPELRRTQSGVAVTSFSLAVERDYKDAGGNRETDFIDVVAWRGDGGICRQVSGQGQDGGGDRVAAGPQLAGQGGKQAAQHGGAG